MKIISPGDVKSAKRKNLTKEGTKQVKRQKFDGIETHEKGESPPPAETKTAKLSFKGI